MNWKKIMAVGLAAVSMMAFVSGCGSDTKKADTQLPKKIVIGLDDSFPPMGFKDDKGEIVGWLKRLLSVLVWTLSLKRLTGPAKKRS